MKRIITSIVAVMLLFTMVFSMASCFDFGFGSVDMDELGKAVEKLDEDDYLWNDMDEKDLEAAGQEYMLRVITVAETEEDGESIRVVQYASKEIAKRVFAEMNYESSEEKKEEKRELKLYEALSKAGIEEYNGNDVDEWLEEYEKAEDLVCVRKGDVIIYGSKELQKMLDI